MGAYLPAAAPSPRVGRGPLPPLPEGALSLNFLPRWARSFTCRRAGRLPGGVGGRETLSCPPSGGEVPSPPDRDGASTLDFSVAAAGALFHLPKGGTANRVGADDREALFPPSLWWGLPHRHGRQGKARRRSVFHRSGEYCPPGRGETAPLPPSSGPLGQGWPSGLLGREQLLPPGPGRALKGKERLSARLIPAPLKRERSDKGEGRRGHFSSSQERWLQRGRKALPPLLCVAPSAKERAVPPFGRSRPLSFLFQYLRLKRLVARGRPSPPARARGMHPAGPPPPTGRGCRGPAPPAAGAPR